ARGRGTIRAPTAAMGGRQKRRARSWPCLDRLLSFPSQRQTRTVRHGFGRSGGRQFPVVDRGWGEPQRLYLPRWIVFRRRLGDVVGIAAEAAILEQSVTRIDLV